jgi:hypothetical protein
VEGQFFCIVWASEACKFCGDLKFRYFSDMRKGKLFFNIYEGRAAFVGFYLFVCQSAGRNRDQLNQ